MRTPAATLLALAVAALAGCTSGTPTTGPVTPSATAAAPGGGTPTAPDSPTATGSPAATPAPEPTSLPPLPTVAVTATSDVVTGLDAPWGIAFLPDGGALVTLRDEAQVVLVRDGSATPLDGPGAQDLAAGTRTGGEGGLLGVAVAPATGTGAGADPAGLVVYLYRTAPGGNEVLRARLDGTTLTALEVLLGGIPAAGNHNGGRLAFGPDGFLYVTTGDAAQPSRAQDPASLGGKILRLTADGAPAPGNPDPASPVWSLGHRNVQGIGWAADGTMFAAEFGQNTWDELNVITPGGNYGWPSVEGAPAQAGTEGFVAPVATWPTSDASPSGLAVTEDGVELAGLRGQRLWRVPVTRRDAPGQARGAPQALLAGELGRLRAVAAAPDGSLWVATNNTDGRGTPRPGDDRIVRVTVG